MNKLWFGALMLLAGCDEKSNERGSTGNGRSRAMERVGVSASKLPAKDGIAADRPGFDLKEIPVKRMETSVPEHIAEVDSDIRSIMAESPKSARKIWDKYYQITLAQENANEVVHAEAVWTRLTNALASEKPPASFYPQRGGDSINLKRGLYGLYLASFMASSNGGGELAGFVKDRAGDGTVKRIDLDLYRIIVSGILDGEGSLSGMTFKQWVMMSKAPNPVYKMLAIQIGHRLSNEVGHSAGNLNPDRLKYFEAFLNDDSKRVRIEALKCIRNLGNELAQPVLGEYLNGRYGETDRIEVEKVFGM